ncbi:MAG: histone deacetylase [Gammaproteobacteria bacterium]|nr:histone deacetylase [Gammaproteobacteria bacterium]
MPIRKFSAVADAMGALRLPVELCAPQPVSDAQLLTVHTPAYVDAVRSGSPRALAESQKFPWSDALATAVRWTNGAVCNAAETALDERVAGALCSGFHHAHADHGEGFCTFNGLVIALEDLYRKGRIRRALVIDLDLHYGNGTVSLLQTRPWAFNLSVYGSWYKDNVASTDVDSEHATDSANCRSIAVPNGASGDNYLDLLRGAVQQMIATTAPDLILYQAGADPFEEDPYSPLQVNMPALYERDRFVFATAYDAGIPIAWVLAGGYTRDMQRVVDIHVNTCRAAIDVFGSD